MGGSISIFELSHTIFRPNFHFWGAIVLGSTSITDCFGWGWQAISINISPQKTNFPSWATRTSCFDQKKSRDFGVQNTATSTSMPPFFSSSAFGGISIEWRSHRAAWPASNGFSLSSCAHHPIEISEILLFPWKNTNTLTPFPNCEHLKKTSHTQLSNPKKGELKNIYKRFLVDLSQLIAGKVLTFLTSHRQVVTWTKGEKGRLKKLDKWRFSKWDDKNESFTSPWLKILSVPKMEVNVVMNWSLYSWGIELISFRYSAPVSIPRNKIDRFDWLYTSPVDIWNSAPKIYKSCCN